MKNILIGLLVFCFSCSYGQDKSIKIAYLGDSHCNGGFGLGDSNWIKRTDQFFRDRGFTVTSYKFCSGGETIRSGMPGWYPGSIPGRNIDAALAVNPDIVLMLYSGNHTAFGIKQDTSKYCYSYLADTLQRLGKRFMFSNIGPRQNTYSGGMTFTSYNLQADSLNTWLYENFPGHIFNMWDTLRDKLTGKPYAFLLLNDSLHYWQEGHRRIWQMTLRDSPDIDTLVGYSSIKAINARFTSTGVIFDQADFKYVEVYGSNDGKTFTQLTYKEFTKSKTYSAIGYAWMKLVVYNNKRKNTITKRF